MKSIRPLIVSLVVFTAVAARADLKVGDSAPALSIKDWVKGEPVDLAKAKPGEIYVIEFWATWCSPCVGSIPHMSDLADYFKTKNVRIVGISAENKSTIEKFLARGFDAKMRYTVATDDGGKTNTAWLNAAGRNGIPCAFVVKDGKLQWIGHPMQGLDEIVANLAGDKAYMERKQKLESLAARISDSAGSEKWDAVHAALIEYVKLDPDSVQHQVAIYHVLLVKLNKPADAAKHGREFVAAASNAEGLDWFAWQLVKHQDFEGKRDLPLAASAAKKATDLTKEESPEALDTYAMVLAATGKLDEAVKLQEKAVAKCPADDNRSKVELTNHLEEYRKKLKKA